MRTEHRLLKQLPTPNPALFLATSLPKQTHTSQIPGNHKATPTNASPLMPPRQPPAIEADASSDDQDSSNSLTENSEPYVFRHSFPEMLPAPSSRRTRKRTAAILSLSDNSDNGDGPSTKRRRRGSKTQQSGDGSVGSGGGSGGSHGNHATPIEIEDIDLTEDPNPLKDALQKQREEQIKAQKEASNQPPSLTKFTCVICMDTPTDLTATNCGEFYPTLS
jgi:hypothetical protein